jgi:nucleotide-binding universal stress UspA family protein
MTIVCATEFSVESSVAVSVAAELAKKHDQRLLLVHVLTSALIRGADVEAAASVALAHDANELARTGVKVDVALLQGSLGETLGQFCRDRNASLLVVGDTHDTGTVLATTLDKLAYAVEVPMLVVRDPKPFLSWIADETPLKVMLALDHSAASAVARNWIFRLAEYGPIDLVGAHIWWPHEEYERRGSTAPADDETHTRLARVMRVETENALSTMPANVTHRMHLEMGTGHIDEQLMALGVEEKAALMVLGTHRYRMLARLTSVSHHVLGRAPMSIACVPDVLGLLDAPVVAVRAPAGEPEPLPQGQLM